FLTEEEIKNVLTSNTLGRIGCTDGNVTYVVPITYFYNGRDIIMHSKVGMKIGMMRSNPQVCFEVDELHSFDNWKSVIAWGKYEEVLEPVEKESLMKSFVERMLYMKMSVTALPPEQFPIRLHPRDEPFSFVVYKIVLDKMTGRYESPEA
ncbi:MAG TPA: pyridoxamine 5'-phosphate oxidase family protein, partial [Flavisolibacter sp.]|nr:pyridoxamine 5'-phosphate oxidase family protein [Flavisolibacter sp.]